MSTMHRRRLPHFDGDGIVFTTWRILPGSAPLTSPERDIAYESLVHFAGERFTLHAGVIMDDHVHVLARPRREWSLSQLKHSWKSFSAHRMQRETDRHGAIWQDECYDRTVPVDASFASTLEYIVTNPFKRWPSLASYPWIFPEDRRVNRKLSARAGAEAGPTEFTRVAGAEAGPTEFTRVAGPTDVHQSGRPH